MKIKILLALAIAALNISAQSTNVIVLSNTTKLVWDANPATENIAFYRVTLTNPAGTFNKDVTVNTVLLKDITTNLVSGNYSASVVAVNTLGLASAPSTTVTATLSKVPTQVLNVKFEGTITGTITFTP
jgi:hypothetical protein